MKPNSFDNSFCQSFFGPDCQVSQHGDLGFEPDDYYYKKDLAVKKAVDRLNSQRVTSYADIATIVGVHLNVYLDYIKAEFTKNSIREYPLDRAGTKSVQTHLLISCFQYMPSAIFLVFLFMSLTACDCFPASVIQERKRSPTTLAGRDRHRAQLSGTTVDHHFGCVLHCVGSGYLATGHLLRCSGCH